MNYKNIIEQAKGKRNLLNEKLKKSTEEKTYLEQYKIDLETAQVFLQKVAQDTQVQLRFHIKDIVQLSLDAIFPGEFEFDIEFEIKRGKTEARLVFKVEGEEINPIDADGGGAVDIAAMALRVSVWALGKTRPTICLDEPFHFFDNTLQQAGAEILKELSEQLGIQFLIVTHRPEIAEIADKSFMVSQHKVNGYRVSEVVSG